MFSESCTQLLHKCYRHKKNSSKNNESVIFKEKEIPHKILIAKSNGNNQTYLSIK